MGQLENWKMTPLDALLCSNQLQILKTLVFFFPPARQRQMIFLVKLMELKQCLTMPLIPPSVADPSHCAKESPVIFESVFPYCDREKQQLFQQIQQAFQMVNTVRQFSDLGLFDHFTDLMGNSNPLSSGPGGNAPPPTDSDPLRQMMNGSPFSSMLSSVMNPEQQALVAEYEAMLDEL